MPDPLNVYLLLDVSASMSGAALEALKQGARLLCAAIAGRSMRVSMISYESSAAAILPPTQVDAEDDFENTASLLLHTLEAAGSSGLGGAFRLLAEQLQAQPAQPVTGPKLVYLFTDGEPTDDWEPALALLRPHIDRLYGLACGLGADRATLEKIADESFWLGDLTSDRLVMTFRAFA